MQKIDFEGEVQSFQAPAHVPEIAPQDVISDPAEIHALIRRAVILSWKDQLFSYDELAHRLAINGVQLELTTEERDAWFEQTILELWHTQKELARTALQPLPTLVRNNEYEADLIGIVTPGETPEPSRVIDDVKSPEIIEARPQTIKPTTPERTVTKEIAAQDIARIVFYLLTQTSEESSKVQYSQVVEAARSIQPTINPKLIRSVVQTMLENGYITSYLTGHKKKSNRWLVMDADTKQDVIEEINEGTFERGLAYIFDE